VGAALELVQLQGYGKRRPGQLSGASSSGWRWRGPGAQPAVLLLDEPLGALDAKLRRALQVELKASRNTSDHVPVRHHDQEEA